MRAVEMIARVANTTASQYGYKSKLPAEETGQHRADHITGVIGEVVPFLESTTAHSIRVCVLRAFSDNGYECRHSRLPLAAGISPELGGRMGPPIHFGYDGTN